MSGRSSFFDISTSVLLTSACSGMLFDCTSRKKFPFPIMSLYMPARRSAPSMSPLMMSCGISPPRQADEHISPLL